MLDARELDDESAELLPGREALGKFRFSFFRTSDVTRHIAHVNAENNSIATNIDSDYAIAQSEAAQNINIAQ